MQIRRHINGMGQIRDWCKSHQMTIGNLAERVGVAESTLHRIDKGEQMPGVVLAWRIERETNGSVTMQQIAKGLAK